MCKKRYRVSLPCSIPWIIKWELTTRRNQRIQREPAIFISSSHRQISREKEKRTTIRKQVVYRESDWLNKHMAVSNQDYSLSGENINTQSLIWNAKHCSRSTAVCDSSHFSSVCVCPKDREKKYPSIRETTARKSNVILCEQKEEEKTQDRDTVRQK